MKKNLRTKSRRQSCAKRYKIEKKVRAHNKKLKRIDNKNKGGKVKRKDPGIPNECPFKPEIMAEAAALKAQMEEEKLARREENKLRRAGGGKPEPTASAKSLFDLVDSANSRADEFEVKLTPDEEKMQFGADGALRSYYKEFRKVVEMSDVVLEVLDARDPAGTRCPQVEELVLAAGKRLVLVLNKIDLVPVPVAQRWQTLLKTQFPTVAFKACTQTQRDNLGQVRLGGNLKAGALKSKSSVGADQIMRLLNNYARSKGVKTAVSVGVVGYPNTGKSSLINSLTRKRVCTVGAQPGVTRSAQTIALDKHVKLVDSPGVVMAKDLSTPDAVLRCAVKPESVTDPIPLVEIIIKRCGAEQIMLAYSLPEFTDATDLLVKLAEHTGRIRKGGIPDTSRAATVLLHDWSAGKLRYYTEPPTELAPVKHLSAEIVSAMAAEFDLDKVDLTLQPEMPDAESEDAMEVSHDEVELMRMATERRKKPVAVESEEEEDEDDAMPKSVNLRKDMKKRRKQKKRNSKLSDKLSDSLEEVMGGLTGDTVLDEDYDMSSALTL